MQFPNLPPEHQATLQSFFNRPISATPSSVDFENLAASTAAYRELKLPQLPLAEMMQEYHRIAHKMVPHYNRLEHLHNGESNYALGWKAACLHGIDVHLTEGSKVYGMDPNTPMSWTSLADECKLTVDFLKSLPFKSFNRIRYMLLDPQGYTLPHTDYPHMHFKPLNFALSNPEGSVFRFADHGEVPFAPGKGYIVNIGYQHTVVNFSNEPRVHIIVHGSWDIDKLKNGDLL